MKKILYFFFATMVALSLTSCEDGLNDVQVSGGVSVNGGNGYGNYPYSAPYGNAPYYNVSGLSLTSDWVVYTTFSAKIYTSPVQWNMTAHCDINHDGIEETIKVDFQTWGVYQDAFNLYCAGYHELLIDVDLMYNRYTGEWFYNVTGVH